MFDLLLKALPPATKTALEAMPEQLAEWGKCFKRIEAAGEQTLATVTRIELTLSGSAVTPELHETASAMSIADPRNAVVIVKPREAAIV